WQQLPGRIQQVILHGSGKENINFTYSSDRGQKVIKSHPFEGVIPNLERRYRETDSQILREELSRLLTTHACPDCHGSRLKQASRHVFVGQVNLPSVVKMPLGEAREYFGSLTLEGRRGEIAARILQEIVERLNFLVNVGLDYLSLDRSAET